MIKDEYITNSELLPEDKFIEVDKTFFQKDVDQEIAELINEIIVKRQRVRIFYGNRLTGRDSCIRFDTIGYIIRSNDPYPQPVLVKEFGAFITYNIDCSSIVKITIKKKPIYKHPKYHIKMEIRKENNLYVLYKFGSKYPIFSSPSKYIVGREEQIYLGNREK